MRYEENNSTYSPLKLLYTAYSDERPVFGQIMEEGFQKVDQYLSPLPKENQTEIFRAFYGIYSENERLAFQQGMRIGFRLAEELRQDMP